MSCARPPKVYAPEFPDLVNFAVGGIFHDEFIVTARQDDNGRISLVVASETRHVRKPSLRLEGNETMAEVLGKALELIQAALVHDAAYRFKFKGSTLFAVPE